MTSFKLRTWEPGKIMIRRPLPIDVKLSLEKILMEELQKRSHLLYGVYFFDVDVTVDFAVDPKRE